MNGLPVHHTDSRLWALANGTVRLTFTDDDICRGLWIVIRCSWCNFETHRNACLACGPVYDLVHQVVRTSECVRRRSMAMRGKKHKDAYRDWLAKNGLDVEDAPASS